jgi:heme exporter protein D
MKIFKLDKAIENEKLDLEMAMVQLNKAKEHLSQSLKRRKELAREMNDHQYVETRIEDLIPSSSSNEASEANNAIKELLQKNGSLQEEVRKLRREQESQSVRLCEIMEQRNMMQQEI